MEEITKLGEICSNRLTKEKQSHQISKEEIAAPPVPLSSKGYLLLLLPQLTGRRLKGIPRGRRLTIISCNQVFSRIHIFWVGIITVQYIQVGVTHNLETPLL